MNRKLEVEVEPEFHQALGMECGYYGARYLPHMLILLVLSYLSFLIHLNLGKVHLPLMFTKFLVINE